MTALFFCVHEMRYVTFCQRCWWEPLERWNEPLEKRVVSGRELLRGEH